MFSYWSICTNEVNNNRGWSYLLTGLCSKTGGLPLNIGEKDFCCKVNCFYPFDWNDSCPCCIAFILFIGQLSYNKYVYIFIKYPMKNCIKILKYKYIGAHVKQCKGKHCSYAMVVCVSLCKINLEYIIHTYYSVVTQINSFDTFKFQMSNLFHVFLNFLWIYKFTKFISYTVMVQ